MKRRDAELSFATPPSIIQTARAQLDRLTMRSVGFGAAENLSHRLGSRKDDVAFGGSGLAAFCGRRQSRHQEFCTAGYAAAATPASVSQKRNTFLSHLDLWSGSNIDDETSELPEAM